ncbi:hypothetical protein [Chitinivorax sp. B]|uniref:hypothetical protein n=1 Tax=Chitinivorax sp. B TaxID=2502235 RepID=UPI0010F9B3BA|nr:hypothetical protein [Chitinivorax sp. B]
MSTMSNDSPLDWLLGVIAGDFNDDPTTAQVIVGSIITAIPFVDQLADIRDIVANIKKVNDDSNDSWAWVALVITLIGLIPTFGSLLKGVLKLLVRGIKKGGRYLDEALDLILALVRGSGKGDPVRYLKSIPWETFGRQALERYVGIINAIKTAVLDLQHRWLAKQLIGSEKLAKIASQLDMLKRQGYDQIPKTMRFLKAELDKLLARAKPAEIAGQTETKNALKHSEKPLLRLEYEIASKRMVDKIDEMKKAGKSDAEIADFAVKERRRLQIATRKEGDPDLANLIAARNKKVYNDPEGINAKRAADGRWQYEQMVKGTEHNPKYEIKYKTDEEMISGAMRSGGDDFPWEKVLELGRARKSGDVIRTKELVNEIKKIMRL